MDKADIKKNMNHYNALLEDYFERKIEILHKLNEALEVERRFNCLDIEFQFEQECRKMKLERALNGNPINAIRKYYLSMHDLLNGSKSFRAYISLEEGKRKISFEIRQLENELKEIEQKMSRCSDNLNYWENEYKNYKE